VATVWGMDQDNNQETAPQAAGSGAAEGSDIVEELLVEEISIDGMCGVY
jgi:mycofactocin precursor